MLCLLRLGSLFGKLVCFSRNGMSHHRVEILWYIHFICETLTQRKRREAKERKREREAKRRRAERKRATRYDELATKHLIHINTRNWLYSIATTINAQVYACAKYINIYNAALLYHCHVSRWEWIHAHTCIRRWLFSPSNVRSRLHHIHTNREWRWLFFPNIFDSFLCSRCMVCMHSKLRI